MQRLLLAQRFLKMQGARRLGMGVAAAATAAAARLLSLAPENESTRCGMWQATTAWHSSCYMSARVQAQAQPPGTRRPVRRSGRDSAGLGSVPAGHHQGPYAAPSSCSPGQRKPHSLPCPGAQPGQGVLHGARGGLPLQRLPAEPDAHPACAVCGVPHGSSGLCHHRRRLPGVLLRRQAAGHQAERAGKLVSCCCRWLLSQQGCSGACVRAGRPQLRAHHAPTCSWLATHQPRPGG